MEFAKDTILLKKYRPDPAAEVPAYDTYTLENVMIRETFAVDKTSADADGATVYFLRNVSICRDSYGRIVPFPRLAKGDLCVLHGGSAAEESMRVAAAGYFTGGNLAHVRVKLK